VSVPARRLPTDTDNRTGLLALACADQELAHVLDEVRAVVRVSGGLALTGAAASWQTLRQQALHFRWLHLAGHAHFESSNPLTSGVDLADGRLSSQQLLQGQPLGFALAWVNGCASGRSVIRPGDELLGFVRGLLASVAPVLLLTLWPVEDLSARIFAHIFYTQLSGSGDDTPLGLARDWRKATAQFRALSQAEARSILREDGHKEEALDDLFERLPHDITDTEGVNFPFAHPSFWAAYALIGMASPGP